MKRLPLKDKSKIRNSKSEIRNQQSAMGFTLIELLLAVALFSIIAVAIYSSLAVGIKVHRKGSYIGGECSDLGLALDRISKDLCMAVHANNIYLVEESQKLYFFSIQPTSSGATELFKITYTWEREKDYYDLFRLKETYIDSVQDLHPKGDKLMDKIRELSFDYGYIKKSLKGEEEFQWKEGWEQEAMPKMVRLSVELNREKFIKVIYCPAGKMGESKEE